MSENISWATLFRQSSSAVRGSSATQIGAGLEKAAVASHPTPRVSPLAGGDAFGTQALAAGTQLAEGSRELLAAAQALSRVKSLYVVKD